MSPFDLDDLKLQHEQLRRIARAIVGDTSADDVVQDAWAAALARRDRAPIHWGRWLNRVTHNLAWKRRLKDHRGAAREQDRAAEAARGSVSPVQVITEIETKHILERAILDLDEPYRSALLWRYYEGLSIEEVSRRAGTIPSTTRTHLQRGLDRLRARLKSERGSGWRLALLPFLRHEPVAAPATAAAVLVGVWTMTWMKWCAAALVAATIGALWVALADDSLEPREAATSRLAAAPTIPPEGAAPARGPAAIAPVESRDPVAVEERATEATAAPDAPRATLEVVDAASQQPLGGVALIVHHAIVKRRFFVARTERIDSEVVTDDAGRAVAPIALDAAGQSPGGAVYATIPVDPRGVVDVQCAATGLQDDGSLRLVARCAAAFRVRLPEELSDEDAAAVTMTICIDRPHVGRTAISSRLWPARTRGRELLVLVPHYLAPIDPLAGAVKIATSATGPSFEAPFERLPGLADEALEAVRSSDVIHTFRVIDEDTGEPVEGAGVAVGRVGGPRGRVGERSSAGFTDARGEVELIGVPVGEARVIVRGDGFDDHRSVAAPAAGASTEIRLRPIPDVRDVAVTIRAADGDPPGHISCRVSDAQGGFVANASAEIGESRGSWIAEGVLENVPPGVAFLEVEVIPPSYDPVGPIRIEPGADEVEVVLAGEVPLVQVVLDLPLDADARFYQGARGRRLAMHRGRFSGVSPVTTAPDDGRPVLWIVDAAGYVPAYGTEEQWRRTTHEGHPCVTITPELQRGWGLLVHAVEVDVEGGLPFQFRTEEPIAGAAILHPETGAVLGATDSNGYAVVTADAPLDRIEVRYGGRTKSVRLNGARRASLTF